MYEYSSAMTSESCFTVTNRMKRLFLLLTALICAAPLHAQVLCIRDAVTHEPLEQAALYSREPRISSVTDAKGRVDIAPFTNADSIHVEMIGYVREVFSHEQLAAAPVLFLRQTHFAMNEIVVSATRWKQNRDEVPARMITLTRSDAAMQNVQTSADLLAVSGEIFVQKSQLGGGSPMIRGFCGNKVLLAVDGVRMNTSIFRRGNLQNVISLDPFSLERTEIVFGPGSVMYGSDAIGGVMSFSTLIPAFSNGDAPLTMTNVTFRGSSANSEKTGHLDLHIGLKRWALISGVTYSDFGDLRMGGNGPDDYLRPEYAARIEGRDTVLSNPDPLVQKPSGYHQISLMQKIRYRPDDAWDINYGAHYSTTSDYPRYDRLVRYRGDDPRSAEWYYGPQVWMMHALNVRHSNGGGIYDKLTATAAYQVFGESRHDRDFGKRTRFNKTESVDALSMNIDAEKNLSDVDLLHYGMEIIHNTSESVGEEEDIASGVSTTGSSRYPGRAVWNSWAVFTNYRRELAEDFQFHGGARYNIVTLGAAFDTTFYAFPFTDISIENAALNGSLGIVYSPGLDWHIAGNVSTGFRAPNVDDMGKIFDATPGRVVVPNPDLASEYAYNAELSVRKTISERLKVHLTGYYTLLDDALVLRDFSFKGKDSLLYDGEMSRVQAMQNAAFAEVSGIQADVELRLLSGFGLESHFNYQKGVEELDDGSSAPLRDAAPWFGLTRVMWAGQGLALEVSAVYNGPVAYDDLAPEEQAKDYLYAKDSSGKPYSPAWYTLNLKARYRFSDALALTFGIENITDRRYRSYSSGIASPGLNLIGALNVRF